MIKKFYRMPVPEMTLLLGLLAGIFATIFLSFDHISLGNGSIFPLHALSLVQDGTLNFLIPGEPGGEFELNFHTPLYTLWLSAFFLFTTLFTELDAFSINVGIKIANAIPIIACGYVFSLFFPDRKGSSRFIIVCLYLALPTSYFGLLSADMDQALNPLFLLLAFYCIEKKIHILWPVLWFALAILTKENTSMVFMVLILFGQVFFLRNLSFLNAVKIAIYSASVSLIAYLFICNIFGLDPAFLFTTPAQLKSGSLSSSFDLTALAINASVQARLFIQLFSPMIILVIPALLTMSSVKKPELWFLFILFFSVYGINSITGYVNIRYFSALAPIMLVLLSRINPIKFDVRLGDLMMLFAFCAVYIAFVDDQYLYLAHFRDLDTFVIVERLVFLAFFCLILLFVSFRLKEHSLAIFCLCSLLLNINLGLKDYQINYNHGNENIQKIIDIVGDTVVFSDLPAAGLYMKENVEYITPAISHWHSSYSMQHPEEREVVSEERVDRLVAQAKPLSKFFIWTKEESLNHKYLTSQYACLSDYEFRGYNFFVCTQ